MFSADLMLAIARSAVSLRPGSILVTLTKPLPLDAEASRVQIETSRNIESASEDLGREEKLECASILYPIGFYLHLRAEVPIRMSWGTAQTFIYVRKES